MRSTIEKLGAWASEHLSVEEEGMLSTLHPHLTSPRHAVAVERARRVAAEPQAAPRPGARPDPAAANDREFRFASTLETFAKLSVRLDEHARSLPEEEQQAFTSALLGEVDPGSLLRHLFATSSTVARPQIEPRETEETEAS